MNKIYIVGGDGFARECYIFLKNSIGYNKDFCFGGFLGHNGFGENVDYKSYQKYYICDISKFNFKKNDKLVIGAGYPELRRKIYEDIKQYNVEFHTIISQKTYISDSAIIGKGNIILGSSSISANVTIGDFNVLNGDVIIGHDSNIGSFNFFAPRSIILGNINIKDMNSFGANSTVLPKANIGSQNKISPLCAVYKGCGNNCYLIGNPANIERVEQNV